MPACLGNTKNKRASSNPQCVQFCRDIYTISEPSPQLKCQILAIDHLVMYCLSSGSVVRNPGGVINSYCSSSSLHSLTRHRDSTSSCYQGTECTVGNTILHCCDSGEMLELPDGLSSCSATHVHAYWGQSASYPRSLLAIAIRAWYRLAARRITFHAERRHVVNNFSLNVQIAISSYRAVSYGSDSSIIAT